MTARSTIAKEDPAAGARVCLDYLPYRMVVFARMDQHNTPLYFVAGLDAPETGSKKALKAALAKHGGRCFYCKAPVTGDNFTIDHAEAESRGGGAQIQNLLLACKPCNAAKGHQVIEAFRPDAGREWLSALLDQVQGRLNRL